MLRNVTVTLDEETARWARLEAARRETSVSRLMGEMLGQHKHEASAYDAAMDRFLSREPSVLRQPGERLPDRDAVHDS